MSDNELTLTYLDGLMRGREEAAEQLAAAQAREAQLREVLADVEAKYRSLLTERDAEAEKYKAEGDMYRWNFHMGVHSGAVNMHLFLTQLIKLLALPADDTALRARLKAERERVIALCDSGYWNDAGDLIRAIRNLGDE